MHTNKLFSKDFTLVVLGQIISLFGNAILRFALPLYLLRETNSPKLFGLVTACSFLPMILLSFLGGVLADRVNKRNIMVILDFLTAFLIVVFFISLDKLPIIPLFIVMLMLLFGISGTYQPTVQASIPYLVGKEQILAGSAVINQISALSNLLGPVIGGVLFGLFGIVPILLISIACFFASAVMELFIKIPFQRRIETMSFWGILKQDFCESRDYLRKEKPILMKVILIIALTNLVLTAVMIVGIPIIIVDTLQMSDQLLGIAQGALALGGLCGGILTAVLGNRLELKKATTLLAACGLGMVFVSMTLLFPLEDLVRYLIICALSFVVMGFATMFSIQLLATLQRETPGELLGKVVAFAMALSMCTQPLGQTIYGFAFEYLPSREGFIVLVAALLSLGITFAARPIFRRLDDSVQNA